MAKLPKIQSVKPVAESRLFRIESVHLQFSNGEERDYDRIQGWAKGSVMIIPLRDDSTILLVREYGVGAEQYVLGFPKGAIHEDESPMETANRELQEEVGYGAKSLSHLTTLSTSPGYLSATISVIVARDLYPSQLEGDEPEPIEVVSWSLKDVDQLLRHPEFIEGRSVAALLWIERDWRAKQS